MVTDIYGITTVNVSYPLKCGVITAAAVITFYINKFV